MQVITVGRYEDLTDPNYFVSGTIYEFVHNHDLTSYWCSHPGVIDLHACAAENVVLRFNGGTLDNGTFTGNQTRIDAPVTRIFKKNLHIHPDGTWNIDRAYSDWFECYKNGYYIDPETFNEAAQTYQYNGVTKAAGTLCGASYNNDRVILQQLLNLSARHTLISEGIYMVDSAGGTGEDLGNQLTWYKKDGLTLQIDGILKMIPNAATNYDVLLIAECTNIKLCGKGKLVGDLPEHPATGGEGGMCLQVISTTRFRLEGLTLEQGWGDGLYVSWRRYPGTDHSPQSYLYIDGIKCLYNRRTGFVVEKGDNIYVTGSQFNYTARFRGTATASGVDIEPFGSLDAMKRYCSEIHFDTCTANGNGGTGFRFQRVVGGSVKNSEASDNYGAVALLNCYWSSEDKEWGQPAAGSGLTAGRIVIDGNTFKNNVTTFVSEESDLLQFNGMFAPSSAVITHNYIQNTTYVLLGGWQDTVMERNNIYNAGLFYYLYGWVSNVKINNNYVLGLNPLTEGNTPAPAFYVRTPYIKDVVVKNNTFKYAGGTIIPGSNHDMPMPYPALESCLFRMATDAHNAVKFIDNDFDDLLWAPTTHGTELAYCNPGTISLQRNFTELEVAIMKNLHLMAGDTLCVNGQVGLVTTGGWIYAGRGATQYDPNASYKKNQVVFGDNWRDMFVATGDGSPNGAPFPYSTSITTVGTLGIRHIAAEPPVIQWQGVGNYDGNPASVFLSEYNTVGRRLINNTTGDMVKWNGSTWVNA